MTKNWYCIRIAVNLTRKLVTSAFDRVLFWQPLASASHRTAELALATAASFATSAVAYRASAVLCAMLLHTAPRRRGLPGLPSGRIEALLRATREGVECHLQVLQLPAPYIRKITLGTEDSREERKHGAEGAGRKRRAGGDKNCMCARIWGRRRVRWAWERCSAALVKPQVFFTQMKSEDGNR
ncbi:hypothetical protein C8J57DRAFT_1562930 [Mycena rebaudengoi]|nr:hypothetical protein C8J57DRAFT_1562930 [Mycena rebaudengoi]